MAPPQKVEGKNKATAKIPFGMQNAPLFHSLQLTLIDGKVRVQYLAAFGHFRRRADAASFATLFITLVVCCYVYRTALLLKTVAREPMLFFCALFLDGRKPAARKNVRPSHSQSSWPKEKELVLCAYPISSCSVHSLLRATQLLLLAHTTDESTTRRFSRAKTLNIVLINATRRF